MTLLAAIRSTIKRLDRPIQVVSFDVFDTLLLRICPPTLVARIAVDNFCRALALEGESVLCVDELFADRREFTRRKEAQAHKHGTEWLIDGWYAQCALDRDVDVGLTCELGRAAELAAERACTVVAPGARDAISALRESGLSIVAMSDTTLSVESLSDLLKHAELEFDHVFSSGSCGVSKRRGALFSHVAQALGTTTSEMLHVGDNFKADAVRAAGAGARFLWLPPDKPSIARRFGRRLDSDIASWTGLVSSRLTRQRVSGDQPHSENGGDVSLYNFGYEQVAPVIANFTLWQWRIFVHHRIANAFYIAREGRTLLDAYELLADVLPGSPRRHYARLSRRAVTLAHPSDLLQRAQGAAGKLGNETVGNLLGQFSFEPAFQANILKSCGLQADDVLDGSARSRLRRVLEASSDEISKLQYEQRALLERYLRQIYNQKRLDRIAIVDAGWAGTIQEAIHHVADQASLVLGTYLGVSAQGMPPSSMCPKFGLLRDDFRLLPASNGIERLAGSIRVWELMLAEQVPTALSLRADDSGGVEVAFGPRRNQHNTSLATLQRGIRDGVEASIEQVALLAQLGEALPLTALEASASALSHRVICHPKPDIARQILSWSFEEGAMAGRSHSLGLSNLRAGVAWYPGWLAANGASCLQTPFEAAVEIAVRCKRGR